MATKLPYRRKPSCSQSGELIAITLAVILIATANPNIAQTALRTPHRYINDRAIGLASCCIPLIFLRVDNTSNSLVKTNAAQTINIAEDTNVLLSYANLLKKSLSHGLCHRDARHHQADLLHRRLVALHDAHDLAFVHHRYPV